MNSIYYPLYYDEFSCVADKCTDSCCAKWEIVIDDDTFNKYSSLEAPFGDAIRSYIEVSEDGEKYFRLNNGRCPFLTECGLCDIHLNLGEEFTSKVCRQHPRFIEEYDGFTEVSLSLSCPEAMRLIFSQRKNHNSYSVPYYDGDDDVLSLLINSRRMLLTAEDNFSLLKKALLDTAADDNLDIDCVYVENHPDFGTEFIKDYIYILCNSCEILTSEWKKMLEKANNCDLTYDELQQFISDNNDSLCKALKYFIYRYYLKAVNDLDVYSRGLFILLSVIVSAYIAKANEIGFEEAVRIYSKEIEHSTENVRIILEYLCKI